MRQRKIPTRLDIIKKDGIETKDDYYLAMSIELNDETISDVIEILSATEKNLDMLKPGTRDTRVYTIGYRRLKHKHSRYLNADPLAMLFKQHHKEVEEAHQLFDTPFYAGCLNLVYGMSKSGKSYSIAEIIAMAPLKRSDVIWLDADYNKDMKLLDMLAKHTYHLNHNIPEAQEQLLNRDGKGKIIIFDSLKDFAQGGDLDTNLGAQTVMERLREFTTMGYTVIVIAHATAATKMVGKEIKLKGNSEVITSKSDVVYRLNKHGDFRELETMASRFSNTQQGDKYKLYDLSALQQRVNDLIDEHEGNLSVRELINKLPSIMRSTFQENKDNLIRVETVGKKHIAKCIQEC